MSTVRFVGLDVHADTIAAAVAESGAEVRSLGVIPNRPEAVRKLREAVREDATRAPYFLIFDLAPLVKGRPYAEQMEANPK